jgi:hypothetical protein
MVGLGSAAAHYEVKYQRDDRKYQQKVDQSASNMKYRETT